MSFLRNAKIRTKILSVIVPLCLMGLGATAFMAARYKAADTSYSNFISVDNATAMDLARADRNMAAMAYGAYHALSYEPEDPFLPVVLTIYEKNKTELMERMDRVKRADPSQEAQIDAITSRIKLIASLTDKAIQFAKKNKRSDANAALLTADEHILTASQDVSRFLEDYKARVSGRKAEISAQTDRTIATSLLGLVIVFGLGIGIALFVAMKGITRPINDLRSRMTSLAAGETEPPIAGQDRRDELGDMARAVAVFRDNASERVRLERETEMGRMLTEKERRDREAQKARDDAQKAKDAVDLKFAVDRLAIGLGQLADGDMTCIIEDAFADQLDGLRTNFNNSVDNLRHALKAVGENADGVDRGARDVRTAVANLSRRTALQAASLEETAAALEELTVSMKDASVRAEEAGQLVARTRDGAVRSGEVVADAVTAMNEIERSATEITSIIGVIDEIAFQTNLLALNAAMEAARAGDSGRGFAVVAQEVRELAQRSAAAAREIKELITTCEKNVRSGASLVNATGTSLETIVSEVQEVTRHFVAIVDCIREQTTGLNEINRSVNELDSGTQQNALMVEEQTVASHTLAGEAEALNQLISRFSLGDRWIPETARRDVACDMPVPTDHLLLRHLRVA